MAYFIPAGRDSRDSFAQNPSTLQSLPLLRQVLDAMSNMVVVVDSERRMVAANRAFLELIGAQVADVLGKRPGEAIRCIHAEGEPGRCGTVQHCTVCGTLQAILETQNTQQQVVRECRIVVNTPGGTKPLDLRVTTTPYLSEDERFYVVGIEDISHAKRLAVLQRTFFHDVANTAGCIQGFASYLSRLDASGDAALGRIASLADQLVDEIRTHRDLVQAESGDLPIRPESVRTAAVLEELHSQWTQHQTSVGKEIRLRSVWDGTVVTDRQLLKRVLGNMVKNALEATTLGRTVNVDCLDKAADVVFAVHNEEVMPDEVQLQVFQRSFTTKGDPGRGIGTHSMKLFGERYLGGRVDFVSRIGEGTTFRLTLAKGDWRG
jgi:signal transduction histidine kinase